MAEPLVTALEAAFRRIRARQPGLWGRIAASLDGIAVHVSLDGPLWFESNGTDLRLSATRADRVADIQLSIPPAAAAALRSGQQSILDAILAERVTAHGDIRTLACLWSAGELFTLGLM